MDSYEAPVMKKMPGCSGAISDGRESAAEVDLDAVGTGNLR